MLNAFWHRRNLHLPQGDQGLHPLRLLNAFRHRRNLHPRRPVHRAAPEVQCSTPSGIEGTCTGVPARGGRAGPVLNAFRHRRNLHTPGTGPRDRMQRSAQRLPASKELARRVERDGAGAVQGVLNAFRHRRNLHGRAGSRRAACWRGAQRLPASKELALEKGFKDQFTYQMCSTPSGIEGTCTGRSRKAAPSPCSAQRLPASKELARSSPGWRGRTRPGAQRLPASKELAR